MPPITGKSLCVSIHDVAPATWPECQRLVDAIREVADIPLTFLVVPCFHGVKSCPADYEGKLEGLLARGHELALHGYLHLDDVLTQRGLRNRFVRTVYTQQEGEFAAIDELEARKRIELGLEWFQKRNWPVSGFVAPAWLLGEGGWKALAKFPFEYTTTLSRFYLLAEQESLYTPSLVYTARNSPGRFISPIWASMLGHLLHASPLLRLSLHPRDARYPKLVKHSQYLLEKFLATRIPLTKLAFARQWAEEIKEKTRDASLASKIQPR